MTSLFTAQSQVASHQHLVLALDVLELLGFLVNYPKCTLVLTQKIEYLGFMVDSTEMTLSLPEETMTLIRKIKGISIKDDCFSQATGTNGGAIDFNKCSDTTSMAVL